ncbi:transposase [Marinifilum sp.]|uniref:transposase n=1 Tax=Marinifilum sp. TaxID=2033137 RepID=UPI003BA88DB9
MNFEKDYLYHIYNQGNNRQNIFFNRDNYLLFLRKMQKYITPYSDIIAWCLMPNHFHMMINVREVNISLKDITNGKVLNPEQAKIVRSINDSIAILLRSYTRAINKAENRSGSLFRMTTKANCLNKIDKVSAAWFIQNGITQIDLSPKDYPKVCFDYIHQNPVKAGLVTRSTDWEFSSAKDYASIRNGKLVNKIKAEELGLLDSLVTG